MSDKKPRVVRRRKAEKDKQKEASKPPTQTFRPGQSVVLKDDPEENVGTFVSGPPAVIGDPRRYGRIFPPIELQNKVYVSFPFKGKHHVCLEHIDNIMPAPKKTSTKTKGNK